MALSSGYESYSQSLAQLQVVDDHQTHDYDSSSTEDSCWSEWEDDMENNQPTVTVKVTAHFHYLEKEINNKKQRNKERKKREILKNETKKKSKGGEEEEEEEEEKRSKIRRSEYYTVLFSCLGHSKEKKKWQWPLNHFCHAPCLIRYLLIV